MTDNEKFWLSQKQHIKLSNYYYNYGAFKNKKQQTLYPEIVKPVSPPALADDDIDQVIIVTMWICGLLAKSYPHIQSTVVMW